MTEHAEQSSGGPPHTGADKRPTGIPGFDQLSRGGLPAGAATLLLGGPGAGKTVFALQTVANAARNAGTPAIFVAFEEAPAAIKANVTGFDWAAGADAFEGVHFLDGRGPLQAATTGGFELSGLIAQLAELVRRENAGWVVLDGLDNVLDLLPDETTRRREIYRIAEFLADSGVPALVTGKLRGDEAAALSSYDAMQFAVQAVVRLSGRVTNGVFGRSLRIVKYRGSDHDNIETPFVVDSGGIAVAYHGDGAPQHKLSSDRLPTGVDGLDQVLDGGYRLGSCLLSAGAAQGEKGLLVALDETYEQIAANAAGIGLDLPRHIAEGRVAALSMRSAALASEAFFLSIERAVRVHAPTIVVIDPISAVMETRDHRGPFDAAARLVDFCKSRGITLLVTTLSAGVDDDTTRSRVSTLSDAWIALSYKVDMGERNRALSVVKARGIRHSNQVRELVIGDDGVHLAEVYAGGGEVLMGAARVAQQAQDELDDAERALATERRRRELEQTIAETKSKREALDAALESARRELELTDTAERKRRELGSEKAGRIRRRREGSE